jgi:hypothetical protein
MHPEWALNRSSRFLPHASELPKDQFGQEIPVNSPSSFAIPILCVLQAPLFSEDCWQAVRLLLPLHAAHSAANHAPRTVPLTEGLPTPHTISKSDVPPSAAGAAAVLLAAAAAIGSERTGTVPRELSSSGSSGWSRDRDGGSSMAKAPRLKPQHLQGMPQPLIASGERAMSRSSGRHITRSMGQSHGAEEIGAGLVDRQPYHLSDLPVSEVAATCSRLLLRAVSNLVLAHRTLSSLGRTIDTAVGGPGGARSGFHKTLTPQIQPHQWGMIPKGLTSGSLRGTVATVWRWCVRRAPLATLVDELLPAWRRSLHWLMKCEEQPSHCTPECAAALLDTHALQSACQVRCSLCVTTCVTAFTVSQQRKCASC